MSKVKTLLELAKITRKLKKEGKTLGLITGCFDILHFGHIYLFRFAKKKVDFLIVGIDNDRTIRQSKGKNAQSFPKISELICWPSR